MFLFILVCIYLIVRHINILFSYVLIYKTLEVKEHVLSFSHVAGKNVCPIMQDSAFRDQLKKGILIVIDRLFDRSNFMSFLSSRTSVHCGSMRQKASSKL